MECLGILIYAFLLSEWLMDRATVARLPYARFVAACYVKYRHIGSAEEVKVKQLGLKGHLQHSWSRSS